MQSFSKFSEDKPSRIQLFSFFASLTFPKMVEICESFSRESSLCDILFHMSISIFLKCIDSSVLFPLLFSYTRFYMLALQVAVSICKC